MLLQGDEWMSSYCRHADNIFICGSETSSQFVYGDCVATGYCCHYMERAVIFSVCVNNKHDVLMRAIVLEVLAECKQLPCALCCLCGASTEKVARMFSCVLSFSSQQLAVDAIFIISVAIFIISVTIFVAIFFYQLLLLLLFPA